MAFRPRTCAAPLQRSASLTIGRVEACFSRPIKQAASELGICTTLLKKICRQHGIKRWPYRKVTSIHKQHGGGGGGGNNANNNPTNNSHHLAP